MKTKFIYVFFAAILLSSQISLLAQNKENKVKRERPTPEQMAQKQAKQMVKALMLDDATAAKFTPIYEKYMKELRECRATNRQPRVKKEAGQDAKAQKPDMTDADIAKMLKGRFTQSRKMLDIREKYYNDFSKILSQKQIMKIYQVEKNYANKFKKEFDRRKGQKIGQAKRATQGQQQGKRKHIMR